MDNSFFTYLQQLELMAFFSGYPLIYAIVMVFAGKNPEKNSLGDRAVSMLPFAYALVATLFLGFELKKLYPDYSLENIKLTMRMPRLVLWGVCALLFWIPAISRNRILSLIHSLVFFFFLIKDLLTQVSASSANNDTMKNDRDIYTNSLLLNLGALVLLTLLSFLYTRFKKSKF